MSEDALTDSVAFLGAASLGLGLIVLVLMLTLFFRKTVEIEDRIAAPGTQLDGLRKMWGSGPIGRWIRIVNVFFYFVFRNLPSVGKRIESRLVGERAPLPLTMKLWAIAPITTFGILMLMFFFSGWYLGAFD